MIMFWGIHVWDIAQCSEVHYKGVLCQSRTWGKYHIMNSVHHYIHTKKYLRKKFNISPLKHWRGVKWDLFTQTIGTRLNKTWSLILTNNVHSIYSHLWGINWANQGPVSLVSTVVLWPQGTANVALNGLSQAAYHVMLSLDSGESWIGIQVAPKKGQKVDFIQSSHNWQSHTTISDTLRCCI